MNVYENQSESMKIHGIYEMYENRENIWNLCESTEVMTKYKSRRIGENTSDAIKNDATELKINENLTTSLKI